MSSNEHTTNPSTSNSHLSPQATKTISIFNTRAPGYDAGNGGWHATLALDFVQWLRPLPAGATVLDLACGTGLVTLALAEAVGPSGTVIGVDITPGMLDEARRKAPSGIEWMEHDITDLEGVEAVQRVVREKGGFDVISCCSALALLPDPGKAIRHWAELLKSGSGRMIIDVPTEDKSLQHLFTIDLRDAVGTSLPYDRSWIRDVHSLEELYEGAGLQVEKSWRTRNYVPETEYGADEGERVFEEKTGLGGMYKSFREDGTREVAREKWRSIWKREVRKGEGRFRDGHWLYVTIGRKP